MTMHEFRLLHEYEQEEMIFEQGVFLGNYVRGNKICDVYQLKDFYVKFCYLLSIQGNAIVTIFQRPDDLPFVDEIDLTGLLGT